MKVILTVLLILFLSSCGIDKEASAPISSIGGGDLDTSFNGVGYFFHNSAAGGNLNDEGFDITVDSQNRIVVAGTSTNGSGDSDIVVWRLTEDGVLDTSFATGGIFVHNNAAGGNGDDFAYAVALDAFDNIYVTGSSLNGSGNFDMVIWKLSSAGVLAAGFGSGGIFKHDSAAGGGVHDQGNDIFVNSDGSIYVTGYSDQTVSNRDMAVWKVSTAGTLSTDFSGDGFATADGSAGGEDDIGNSITLNSSNEVFITGRSDSATNVADMAVWKFTAAGAPHTGFNGTGVFTHNSAAGGNAFDTGRDILVDSVGEIFVTGYSRNVANNNDMVVWKLSNAGALVGNFNNTGFFVFNIAAVIGVSTDDTGESITLDNSGNIMVVGTGNSDVGAWRIKPDGTLDTSFNGDGSFFHDAAAGGFANDFGTGAHMDPEGKLLYMTGYSENISGNFDMVVWRID